MQLLAVIKCSVEIISMCEISLLNNHPINNIHRELIGRFTNQKEWAVHGVVLAVYIKNHLYNSSKIL